jgi:uncharacterized protein (TIGR03435 family)
MLATIGLLNGQSAQKFEVASIKPSQPGQTRYGIRPAPGGERYLASNVSLKIMITVAYRVRAEQVSGGPAWMDTEGFDMNAKAERPSSMEELHAMLQDLLADRFKLRFHRESRVNADVRVDCGQGWSQADAARSTERGRSVD